MSLTSACLMTAAWVLVGGAEYRMWAVEPVEASGWPELVGKRLSRAELWRLANAEPVAPYLSFTVGYRLSDGTLWVGSRNGLMLLRPGATRWRLFHSRRWLPDDHVQELAVKGPDEVWVRTSGGAVRIYRKSDTLENKMNRIHAMLRKHHIRFGLVGKIVLKQPGSLSGGWFQPDDDNDGLWTSLYVAAEAFRFATRGDEQARRNAWQSLKALMFLERITGKPGFVARSIVPITINKQGIFPWRRSADGKWWWKGDTSSDELDGHFFAYAVYYDLAATDAQKEQIRAVVGRIMDHIIDHGYYYVEPGGRRTRWGVWAPEKLNRDPDWIEDRGLNSLEILSHLKVAEHICGNGRYREEARKLIEQHGYAINTIRQKMAGPLDGPENHSDDELAFLVYYPLLRYERDPELRRIYLMSLERSWQAERPEHSPFFNLIYAACKQADHWPHPDRRPPEAFISPGEYDRDRCIEWFVDVPEDMIEWTVINSNRRDIGRIEVDASGRPCSTFVLPVSERRIMRWNGNPYQLDGGSGGRLRNDGTFVLLPYWLGRYHRLLAEE